MIQTYALFLLGGRVQYFFSEHFGIMVRPFPAGRRSMLRDLAEIAGRNPVLIVVNKADLLPPDVDLARIRPRAPPTYTDGLTPK